MSKKMSDLVFSTKMWFIARGIEQGDVNKQGLKLIEEMGELVSGYLKNKEDVIKDSIGDVAVVVIGYAMMAGVNPEFIFFDRKEDYLPDFGGVNAWIWMMTDSAFQAKVAQDLGIENTIKYNLSNIILYLNLICKELGYDFTECFGLAYEEIKDRKGRWVNGSFVKEQDLEDGID
jgi:DNA-binding protein